MPEPASPPTAPPTAPPPSPPPSAPAAPAPAHGDGTTRVLSTPQPGAAQIKEVPPPGRIWATPPPDMDEGDPTRDALRTLGFLGRNEELDGGTSKPEPPKPDPSPPATSPAPTKPEAKEAPEAGAPEPPTRERRRRPLEKVTEQLAVATERLAELQQRPQPAPQQPAPSMFPAQPAPTPEEVEEQQALGLLSQSGRYKGRNLPAEQTEYRRKLETYRKSWEARNPEGTFDLDAEDHAGWLDANQPDVDEQDFVVAKAEVRAARRIEDRMQAERLHNGRMQVAAAAEREAQKGPAALAGIIDPALAGKSLAEVEAVDPALAEAIERSESEASAGVRLARTLFDPLTPIPYNEADQAQRWAVQKVAKFEQDLLSLPPQQTVMRDGRSLIPVSDYYRLPEQARGNYWTLYHEPGYIAHLMLADLSYQVQETAERLRRRFPSRGPASSAAEPQVVPEAGVARPAPAPLPPRSAAAGGGPQPPAQNIDVNAFFS